MLLILAFFFELDLSFLTYRFWSRYLSKLLQTDADTDVYLYDSFQTDADSDVYLYDLKQIPIIGIGICLRA